MGGDGTRSPPTHDRRHGLSLATSNAAGSEKKTLKKDGNPGAGSATTLQQGGDTHHPLAATSA